MLLCAATQGSEVGTVTTRKVGIKTRILVGNYPAIKTQSLYVSLATCSLHDPINGRIAK